MTRAVFTGHETLTFSDYRDLETGKTLTAEPGRVYDVAPAGGSVPEVPSPWFVPVTGDAPEAAGEVPAEAASEEAAPEPPGEAEEPQQQEEQQPEDGEQQ